MQNINALNDVLDVVNTVFIEVLENDTIKVTYATTAKDIAEWDSLNHIALVIAIEKKFGIQFTAQQIQEFENVGQMCESILSKSPKS